MNKKHIYLVTGFKFYPAYTGDYTKEWVKILIPADTPDEAKLVVNNMQRIDEIHGVKCLYEGAFPADAIYDMAIS